MNLITADLKLTIKGKNSKKSREKQFDIIKDQVLASEEYKSLIENNQIDKNKIKCHKEINDLEYKVSISYPYMMKVNLYIIALWQISTQYNHATNISNNNVMSNVRAVKN